MRDALLAASIGLLLQDPFMFEWGAINGVGFMSARLVDSPARSIRRAIHIWHPSLRATDMEDSGMIHDHRYGFMSLVMLGAIHDTEVSLTPSAADDGTYQIHEVSAPPNMKVTRLDQRYQLQRVERTYAEGETFSYAPNRFHRAEVRQLTVTLCTQRGDLRGGGRLLARTGRVPEHVTDRWGVDLFTSARVRDLREEAAAMLLDRAYESAT